MPSQSISAYLQCDVISDISFEDVHICSADCEKSICRLFFADHRKYCVFRVRAELANKLQLRSSSVRKQEIDGF